MGDDKGECAWGSKAQESRKQKEKQVVHVCDAGSLKATGTDGWHLGMRTTCDLTARHP